MKNFPSTIITIVYRIYFRDFLTLGMGEAETTARREERRYSIFWGQEGGVRTTIRIRIRNRIILKI